MCLKLVVKIKRDVPAGGEALIATAGPVLIVELSSIVFLVYKKERVSCCRGSIFSGRGRLRKLRRRRFLFPGDGDSLSSVSPCMWSLLLKTYGVSLGSGEVGFCRFGGSVCWRRWF